MKTKDTQGFENLDFEVQTICSIDSQPYQQSGNDEDTYTGLTITSSLII